MKQWIVIISYLYFGPFNDAKLAADWAKKHAKSSPWHVVPLEAP